MISSELQQQSIPNLLTAKEVAEMLRIPKAHVYELARQAKIPCAHIGRLVRFPQARILEWIERGGTDG